MYFAYAPDGITIVNFDGYDVDDTLQLLTESYKDCIYFEAELAPPEEIEPDVERIYNKDLIGLNKNGSRCEVCNRHMSWHKWADLDINGFVVNCSFVAKA